MALGGLVVVASTRCTYPTFVFNGTSSGGGSGAGGGAGGGLSCAAVNNLVGCCDADGVLHYCLEGVPMSEICTLGDTCGWDDGAGFYDCNPAPDPPDPKYPMACGP
jgi:hypothetical protein